MTETTQTPPDAGASGLQAAAPAVPLELPELKEEQRLERLLRRLLKGLVAIVAIFAVVYFFGQRQSPVEQAPSITDQAIISAEASVRSNPNDLTARLALATSYARGNRIEDALKQLNEILKAQPTNRPALLGLGTLMYQQGSYAEAKSALTKYVASAGDGEFAAADPQLEAAQYTLGITSLKLGDAEAAITHLVAALRIEGGDADAWYALGNAKTIVGDDAGAISAFERALAFVPSGWCDPYEGLSKAYAAAGDKDGATYSSAMVRVCNGAGLDSAAPLRELVQGKFSIGSLYGLGIAAEHDGNNTAALSFYQQLLTADRTNIAALSAIARLGGTPNPQPITGK